MKVLEQIEKICNEIVYEIFVYNGYVSDELMSKSKKLVEMVNTLSTQTKDIVEEKLYGMIKKSHLYTKVWLYSVTITLNSNPKLIEEFLEYCIEEELFTPNIKYFLLYRIKRFLFNHINLENNKIKLLKWKLLEQCVKGFKKELEDVLVPIPYKQRNHDRVIVITQQIISEEHGPTKTALDRCKILKEYMHKNILLINTAEILSPAGLIPYYDAKFGSYNTELCKCDVLEWKGTIIPYFQCDNDMPNRNVLYMLLKTIQNQKPGFVVEIGGGSILANLINDMIPVLTIGTVPSDWEGTMTRCQTLGRILTKDDKELLKKMGKEENSIIQSIFTSSLQPQKETITRKELGLSDDKFLLVIIGGRLDTEIDDQFMHMLASVLDGNIEAVLIGVFHSFEKYMHAIPQLKGKIHNLGYTNDILSRIEVCDLYVNPNRTGGGTSSVEAMYKGLPVVTLPYGDVSVNAGEKFFTDSYDTMPDLIRKYKNDTDFYRRMSVYAKERADVLLDSAGEFQRIIKEFEKRTANTP